MCQPRRRCPLLAPIGAELQARAGIEADARGIRPPHSWARLARPPQLRRGLCQMKLPRSSIASNNFKSCEVPVWVTGSRITVPCCRERMKCELTESGQRLLGEWTGSTQAKRRSTHPSPTPLSSTLTSRIPTASRLLSRCRSSSPSGQPQVPKQSLPSSHKLLLLPLLLCSISWRLHLLMRWHLSRTQRSGVASWQHGKCRHHQQVNTGSSQQWATFR
mmetsp:Transcript_78423/g.136062  ORF Transcript_78423/g.136062 Transcript_78423/m.136062 type:complete len:218 (+) Transcript_78423:1035-1688(+)